MKENGYHSVEGSRLVSKEQPYVAFHHWCQSRSTSFYRTTSAFTDIMFAARTNLTSNAVRIHGKVIGEGTFRTCLAGTFDGGNRNGQAAACKRFKKEYRHLEDEYFSQDFQIADKVITIATDWNSFCDYDEEILVSRGSLHRSQSGIKYLVEPLIRDYERFTSNSGWIGDTAEWTVRCMEAFTHYSYEHTAQQMIVCDLEGRYRGNKYKRFELSDPAICSRDRLYGPTDLGVDGIDAFFANHECNEFCQSHWSKPWFRTASRIPMCRGTTFVSSSSW